MIFQLLASVRAQTIAKSSHHHHTTFLSTSIAALAVENPEDIMEENEIVAHLKATTSDGQNSGFNPSPMTWIILSCIANILKSLRLPPPIKYSSVANPAATSASRNPVAQTYTAASTAFSTKHSMTR
jgi:hypothetical protein